MKIVNVVSSKAKETLLINEFTLTSWMLSPYVTAIINRSELMLGIKAVCTSVICESLSLFFNLS